MNQEIPQYINSPGLRQDILSFTEDDPRRRRFFICLKMLAILPCHPENRNLEFNINVKTKTQNFEQLDLESMIYARPQRIHDQLIASHVTCCEHQTPFFSYYHRNLLIYVELQLNYADQYLRFTDTNQIKQFKSQWQAVVKDYKMIIEELRSKNLFQEKVMCHYWNPTNYTASNASKQFTNFPVELLPKRQLQNIDILFEKVNSHLPWNINLRTRLYQLSPEQYKKRNVLDDLSDIFAYEEHLMLNEEEKKIISGESNPRSSDPKMVKHFFDNYIRRLSGSSNRPLSSIISNEVSMRNVEYFQNEGNNQIIPLYNMSKSQFVTNYGMGQNNQQWLNPAQIKEVYKKSSNAKMIPEYYNSLLPHYQFAYAYVKSENSFIGSYLGGVSIASANADYQKKMEHSHNTMHNNSSYIMSDPNFSLTNLIFFPFHSWIDYQLQVKIRQLSDLPSYNKARQELSYNRERTIYDILNRDNGPYKMADYKLVDWVNPRVGAWRWNSSQSHQVAKYFFQSTGIDPKKAFRYSFRNTSFQNFVLNNKEKHIRRSDEMHEIYKDEYQIDLQSNPRFAYFMNLKQYNFNYNFEIFDEGKRIVMDKPNMPVLPSYLARIVDSLTVRTPKITFNSKAQKTSSSQNIQLQGTQFDFFSSFTPVKVKEKILQNPILALGKYSSLIKSGTYHIEIHFLMQQFIQQNKKLSERDIDSIKEGFFLKAISIFSKGQASTTCPKCAPSKKFWVDVADRLRQIFPEIWRALNLYLIETNRVIYTTAVNQKKNEDNQLKTSEILSLKADQTKFKKFSLLEGAEEVEFDVLILNQEIKEEVTLKLDLQLYSMYNEKIQAVVSKTLYSLQSQQSQKHFDFYRMMDLASSSGENNFEEFDKYYYKKVKGELQVGDRRFKFSFQIPNYYRLIRYLVKVQLLDQEAKSSQTGTQKELRKEHKQNEGSEGIFVEIEDRDYQLKRQYYEDWQDDGEDF